MDLIFPQVIDLIKDTRENGGASYNIIYGKPLDIDYGYMISFMDLITINTSVIKDDDKIVAVVDEMLRNIAFVVDDYLGGWMDGDKLYIDMSTWIHDKDKAISMGVNLNQKAIYDIKNDESIYLDKEVLD